MSRRIIILILIFLIIIALIALFLPEEFSFLRHKVWCQKEGEYLYPPGQPHSECCPGLKKISDSLNYDKFCNYKEYAGNYGVCSQCGNNNCEQWESKCNCPKDCDQLVNKQSRRNWERHRNEELGFEISYPGFELMLSSQENALFCRNNTIVLGGHAVNNCYISLPTKIDSIWGIGNNIIAIKSIDDWIAGYESGQAEFASPGHGLVHFCLKKNIADYSGAMCEGSEVGVVPSELKARIFLIESSSGYYQVFAHFLISYDDQNGRTVKISNEKIDNFFNITDQILSTFKILD